MLYGIDFGRPVGVGGAQPGRTVGADWAQVVVWGAAGGCLGAAGGCPGAAGDAYWRALADLDPQQGPQGVHRSRPGSPKCVSKACPGHLQGRKSRKIEILKSAGNFLQKLSPDELLTTQRFPKRDPKDLISIPAALQRVLRVAKCTSQDLHWTSLHLVEASPNEKNVFCCRSLKLL